MYFDKFIFPILIKNSINEQLKEILLISLFLYKGIFLCGCLELYNQNLKFWF